MVSIRVDLAAEVALVEFEPLLTRPEEIAEVGGRVWTPAKARQSPPDKPIPGSESTEIKRKQSLQQLPLQAIDDMGFDAVVIPPPAERAVVFVQGMAKLLHARGV